MLEINDITYSYSKRKNPVVKIILSQSFPAPSVDFSGGTGQENLHCFTSLRVC